ncbi:twin-arginine translocase subunit TatC [Gynuella sunshinyii]|uniref:Sec-independent protein translocase protein TatC n=1 Tax=Gynuella sunshinyii YC6258 TaxID=1445510 RepID=A0A0C5VS60_9GAMM|nr:twin-arginine translocase subunit TatC [Gynuella sunshinyii]AJQ93109.1 sec-independent protein secretion pathway component TatC [Gynuella sunshinyii YC6258]
MTDNPNDVAQPLVAHLKELRDRLIKTIIVVIAIFAVLYYFANDLYVIVSKPLERLLPENIADVGLIATGVTAPFLVPLKLTLVTAVFIAIPFILHQTWGFIAPALYKHEKKFAVPLLISSVLLFYCGIAFAYFVVLPIIFGFFAAISIEGIAYLPDISNVLDFILKIFFAFGIAFEIPIATFLLVWAGIVEIESLRKKRPYIFVGCFAVGMLVTPPDVFSQTILALPMWLLFEIGLMFSRFATKSRESNTASAEN